MQKHESGEASSPKQAHRKQHDVTVNFLLALPVLLILAGCFALSFQALRLFTMLPVAFVCSKLRVKEEDFENINNVVAAALLATMVFAYPMFRGPTSGGEY